MIEMGPSTEPLPSEWLEGLGGFLWWYIDLIDETGSGAVCIWSYGLPFSPGLGGNDPATREPDQQPGWNLVIYRDHKPIFYTLQEPAPEDCSWDRDGQVWKMGDTTFRRTIEDGQVQVNIDFDCQLTGLANRLTGHLTLKGPLRIEDHQNNDFEESDDYCFDENLDVTLLSHMNLDRTGVPHTWEPISLGAAHGELFVQTGDWQARVAGRAYHDRNGSEFTLQDQDIRQWTWGRFAFPDREFVIYLVDPYEGKPEWLWLEVDTSGQCSYKHVISVDYIDNKRSLYGPKWSQTIVITTQDGTCAQVKQSAPIDNGPFYLRHFATAQIGDETANGISELVIPSRIDMAIHRPLVKMRIDNSKPSMWLPLFQGPSTGRVSRLLKSWFN